MVALEVERAVENLDAGRIVERELSDRVALCRHVDGHLAILIVVFQVGHDAYVLHVDVRIACVEVAFACYTRQTPEVLVFTIRTIAPAERLERDEVLARFHVFRDVKLGRYLTIFRVTYILSVDIKIDIRRY